MSKDFEDLVGLLAALCPLKQTAESLEGRLASALSSAASFLSPRLYSRFAVSMAVYPLFGEIIALRFSGEVLPIVLSGLVVLQVLPFVHPFFRAASRARLTDAELPFFVIGLSVFSHESHPTILEGFRRVASLGRSLFRAFGLESSILERNLTFMRDPPDRVIEETFSSSPSRKLREFVHGFTTTISLGKDVAVFVEGEAARYVTLLEDSWRGYSASLASIAEFSFLLLALFPVGLQMVATTLPSVSSGDLLLSSYAVLTGLSLVLLFAIDAGQPKVSNATSNPVYCAIVVISCLVSMILYQLGAFPVWQALLLPLATSAVASARTMKLGVRVRRGDEEVALFVHDLAEECKIGVSLPEALSRLISERSDGFSIRTCLLSFYQALRLGHTPTQAAANVEHPSWFVRMAFALVALAFMTGAGFEQLERLSILLKRVTDAKRAASRALIPFLGLGLAVPAISVFSLSFLSSLTQIGSLLTPWVAAPISGRYSSMSIILSSILTGVLLSKLMTSSVRNMLAVPIVLLATLVSFLLAGVQ